MGRTNMILLGMGILASVVLSLLMQRGLRMQKAAGVDPVVRAVVEVFGDRLQVPPTFQIQGDGLRRVGVLQLVPKPAGTSPRLSRDVGRFVWQQAPWRFDDLVVLLKRDAEDQGSRITIPRPFLARTPPRPAPKPAPKRTPKRTPERTPEQVPKSAPKPASRPASQPSR